MRSVSAFFQGKKARKCFFFGSVSRLYSCSGVSALKFARLFHIGPPPHNSSIRGLVEMTNSGFLAQRKKESSTYSWRAKAPRSRAPKQNPPPLLVQLNHLSCLLISIFPITQRSLKRSSDFKSPTNRNLFVSPPPHFDWRFLKQETALFYETRR